MGRPWWCDCQATALWIADTLSHHTSQHLVDPYSFSHFQHGLVFFLLCALIKRYSLWIPLIMEACWELLENSNFIIKRYRASTIALDYFGDSVINSLGDLASCYIGFLIACKLSVRQIILLYIAIEIFMITLYRDSLILHVIMLLYPVQVIKNWQQGVLMVL
jgi:hypothetical protein